MEDWSVLDLTGDPVPGEPVQIRALATRLKREAEHAEQHTERLLQVAVNSGDLRMRGDYAPAFLRRLAELPDRASRLGPAYESCGNALAVYAESLELAKIQSRTALSRGLQADAQYRAALVQFSALVPLTFAAGGVWRGLKAATAASLSQYQQPAVQQAAVRIGGWAGQAEQERLAAAHMARAAARAASEAEAACARAIRAAAPRDATKAGRTPVAGVSVAQHRGVENRGTGNQWTSDLSHVTGRTARARNRAIEVAMREWLPGLKFTHKPQYSPWVNSGIAKPDAGTHIGWKPFVNRYELTKTLVHEELHHRWFARGIPPGTHHPPDGSGLSELFYRTVNTYLRMRGLVD
ncbi:hypothetical protein [Streptomyces sp. NPDC003247]|uniref:hypothetical protein n=1 Tax=Streptomyces sp. NPDC003247 TaxID=3364677 RepID=UPI00368BC41A